jgi:hypothetical protein
VSQVTAALRWGGLGELTVLVDGHPVFSKRSAGRLPQPGEIVRLVQARRASSPGEAGPPDHAR